MGKKDHKHTWTQGRVALEQKGGRVVAVTVIWQCAGRKCQAETVTTAALRKPAANARPRSESPLTEREVRAAVERAKRQRREGNTGSLAAMEAYAAEEMAAEAAELTAEDFERPPAGDGGHIRPRNVEEVKAALGLLAPLEVSNG